MLRTLLAENMRANDNTFFIHYVPLVLCSKKEFNAKYRARVHAVLKKGFVTYDVDHV